MKTFIKQSKIFSILDKIPFLSLFLVWMLFIILVGVGYFALGSSYGSLEHVRFNSTVSLLDAVYFSFVTATSTGFGDIIPVGYYKILAVFEVVFSLLVFAVVTSKLISIKQMAILKEIYDISFNERINRLRSALHLFRIDLRKISVMAEKRIITVKEISDISSYFALFNDTLNEMRLFITKKADFTRRVGKLELELMLNSVNTSFKRINTVFKTLNKSKYKWKSKSLDLILGKCFESSDRLFKEVRNSERIIKLKKENENYKKEIIKQS